MKKISIVSFVIAVLSLVMSLSLYFQYRNEDKRAAVAGVIRCVDENGWYAIDDKGHKPINIGKIEVKNGLIMVYYTFKASAIHTFIVTPDETFARAGYIVGSSVGFNKAAITVSKIVKGEVVAVDASTIKSKLGNFWIYGLFSIDKKD